MSPKPWRWSGRRPIPEAAVEVAAHPERLVELADKQATGALYVNGRWGGTIFLVRGRIGHVESMLTPGVEALLLQPTYSNEHSWAELVADLRRGETAAAIVAAGQLLRSRSASAVDVEILRRTALADAALATLGTVVPETDRTRTRFRPGEKHWCESPRTFAVADVVAEANRRKAVLERLTLGIHPRRVVRRVSTLPIERVRLTTTQWNIARSADGSTTPLDIAWMLGHSVFATTVAVNQLARLGVVTTDPDFPESPSGELVPARYTPSFLLATIR